MANPKDVDPHKECPPEWIEGTSEDDMRAAKTTSDDDWGA